MSYLDLDHLRAVSILQWSISCRGLHPDSGLHPECGLDHCQDVDHYQDSDQYQDTLPGSSPSYNTESIYSTPTHSSSTSQPKAAL